MSELFLEGLSPRVEVLPVVYFSILDHYQRRNEQQHRVIGTLLGVINGFSVQVTNCFPVPHNETEEQVAVDMDYHHTMLELYQRVNPKEVIVGWYATGCEMSEHSVLIHEFYSKEADNPIHLMVSTGSADGKVSFSACVSAPMGVPDETTGSLFTPVECRLLTFEAERVAVGFLCRNLQTPGRIPLVSDLDHVTEATDSLLKMISVCSEYVRKVLSKEIVGDPKIGRYLLDTVCAIPKVDPAQFEKLFNNVLQDLLMVVYLSNVAKSQALIQEKLNNIQ